MTRKQTTDTTATTRTRAPNKPKPFKLTELSTGKYRLIQATSETAVRDFAHECHEATAAELMQAGKEGVELEVATAPELDGAES